MTTTFRTAGRVAAAVVLGAGLLLAACGDDEDPGAASDDTETTGPATSAADDTGGQDEGADDGEVLEVELADFSFEGLPDSVPAGTRLTVTNSSGSELHELVAVRIPDDETRPVEELIELPEEEIDAILGSGPPATVLLAAPGGEQIDAVGDGTLSEPGRYALVCFIPTGVDPDEFLAAAEEGGEGPPEIPDAGPPHIVHGMYAELVVE